MTNTPTKNDHLRKDLKILIASILLLILVYIKDYTWAWFGSTLFWVIGFSLILFCVFLFARLLVSMYQWGKAGFKESYAVWIYLITIVVLIISIYGMR